MKRTISLLCVCLLVLSCLALTGCDSKSAEIPADSPYVGTWTAVKAEVNGVETDMKEALDGDKFIIILNQDGTASVENTEETSSSFWKITDNGVELTGESDMVLRPVGSQLQSTVVGVTFFFDKTA
ncbi:MAG: hypothetical protein IJI67_05375 [Clostridia bacterium]|nr:hypothetical protein [Clostridia bacterium]